MSIRPKITQKLPTWVKVGKPAGDRLRRIRAILAAPTVFSVAAPVAMTEADIEDARTRFDAGEGVVDIAESYGYDATDAELEAFVDATGIRVEEETDDDDDDDDDVRFGRTEFFDSQSDTPDDTRRARRLMGLYREVYKLAQEFGLFNVGGDMEKEAEDRGAPLSDAWRPEPQLVVIRPLPPDAAARIEIKKVFGRGILVVSIDYQKAHTTDGRLQALLLHELLHIQLARGTDAHGPVFIQRMGEILDAALARGIIAGSDVYPQLFGPDVWAAREAYVAFRKRNTRYAQVPLVPGHTLLSTAKQRAVFGGMWAKMRKPQMPSDQMSPYAPNPHR